MKIVAAGDYLAQRRLPGAYEGFREVQSFIAQGDLRFVNLETVLCDETCYASQYSGGSYLRADERTLEDVRAFGFNALSFNNNHSMDFSYEGLLQTLEACRRYGFPQAGCGRNLDEAAAPAYIDTPAGRFALISVTATFGPAAMAGRQSRRFPGRPGVNGLRWKENYYLPKEQLEMLEAIAKATDINAFDDDERAYGYQPPLPDGTVAFGHDLRFEEAEKAGRTSFCDERDMARVEQAIREAQLQADWVIVSAHSHELRGADIELPDHFYEAFCRKCIDLGALAVLGHGPHLMRPIEVYKGRPILYSMGDFVMQNEASPYAPEDYYEKFSLTSDAPMQEIYRRRSRDFTVGLMRDKRMLESTLALMNFEGDKLTELELMPIGLGWGLPNQKQGWPAPQSDAAFTARLKKLFAFYGTELTERDGHLFVKL